MLALSLFEIITSYVRLILQRYCSWITTKVIQYFDFMSDFSDDGGFGFENRYMCQIWFKLMLYFEKLVTCQKKKNPQINILFADSNKLTEILFYMK